MQHRVGKFGQDDKKNEQKLSALKTLQQTAADPNLSLDVLMDVLEKHKTQICASTASGWRFFVRGDVDSKRLFDQLVCDLNNINGAIPGQTK